MRLKTLFVRFYKSFNFDYLRRHREGVTRFPWEDIDGLWYPFVRIAIEKTTTTVVGANESGKTHLLTAIEKGISGQAIERGDFCRYSRFFNSEIGKSRFPDLGFEWTDLTERDRAVLTEIAGKDVPPKLDRFLMFRRNGATVEIYIPSDNEFKKYSVSDEESKALTSSLPRVFRIDPQVALPDSVSLRFLAGDTTTSSRTLEAFSRADRFRVMEAIEPLAANWTEESSTTAQTLSAMTPALKAFATARRSQPDKEVNPSAALAKDLIRKIARIDPAVLLDLSKALEQGREGYAQGIIENVNQHLATRLNFPKWWAQDKDFALRVAPREFDLVFTIRDRTGTEYSFGERSHGLKYFLSYYIQYLAHVPRTDGEEILVMDEPDTFLSSQAQQDLVKVFEAFATPDDGRPPIQVVYVTHSPFLIDKNHAERIRVLEKGVEEEGTRVVRDASKNHYEPLRSAFGAFVAETTFIGSCNLMVEGLADQVLLAGASAFLRSQGKRGSEVLDLNRITIVPAGSASHVPYLVFLARGRDVERPAVIVLLDSDDAGNTAARQLLRGGHLNKQLLDPKFVLQISDISGVSYESTSAEREIEDLIPIDLCVRAMQQYFVEFGSEEMASKTFDKAAMVAKISDGLNTWSALESLAATMDPPTSLDKVAFARSIVSSVGIVSEDVQNAFAQNVGALFRELNARQHAALKERSATTLTERIERARHGFQRDHAVAANREDALQLFADIEEVLDASREADAVKAKLQELRREFQLTEEVTRPIERFSDFKAALERVKYLPKLITQEEQPKTDGG